MGFESIQAKTPNTLKNEGMMMMLKWRTMIQLKKEEEQKKRIELKRKVNEGGSWMCYFRNKVNLFWLGMPSFVARTSIWKCVREV